MNGLKSSRAMLFGRPHSWIFELGADDDHRTARVVHALAEEVLAETPLLALEHVAQALERTVTLAADGAGAAAVVEQRVDGFLEHSLFVAEDHFRRLDLDELLEPVVPVDDAPVQIVQIGGGEPTALERDEGPQFRRKHRDDVDDHPLGLVVGVAERLDDLEPLQQVLLPLHGRLQLDLAPQVFGEVVEVYRLEELANRLGAHHRLELLALLAKLGVRVLGDQLSSRGGRNRPASTTTYDS